MRQMCVFSFLSLAYELPEDATDMPKHVGAGKDCMDVRGAVKKVPEMWYNSVMVGHMTMLT